MKKIFLLLLMPLFMFSKVHYAKVEPYETVTMKSTVSALVLDVDLDAEATIVSGKRIIYLDDRLDKINLESSKKSLVLLQEMLEINKDIAKSLKSTVNRQENYFTRINRLKTASKTQKDTAFSSFTSAKTQHLNTREKIVNLEKQILDMQYKIAQLEDTITKKSVVLNDKYVYKFLVRKGDYVNPGTSLVEIKDTSRSKLVIFVEAEDLIDIESKSIYLDGEKSEYKIDKAWRVADEKFISSYRVEIVMDAPQSTFSKLMKIELK
ncbi:MAG: Unknown protein [uncultured Sulfurovum sp.]|uniref:HlyD family secretion protein n=1 Tax=uncultured Sulfurovum sp. TaxID=269237 RepID=A0A6S6T1Q2_9BACT|nr:MAG: Unknown protein [uncultured Sulfurovum sp.]